MTWVACERYRMAPAPAGLAVVHDFLNTRSLADRGTDLLSTVRAAQAWTDGAAEAWSAETGTAVGRIRLAAADLDPLRGLRDGLRAVVAGGRPGAAWLADVPLTARTDRSGMVALVPAATGWLALAGIFAIEMHRAQQTDVWRRLKMCRNETCPVAFFDRSRNNAGVWHDVRVCGNVANLRASRARRRAAAARAAG